MYCMQISLRPHSPSGSSKASTPSGVMRDWWVCIPLPFSPWRGFGMNVAQRPCSMATVLMAFFRIMTRSALEMASVYRRSISCWPGATSWWEASAP